MFKRSAFLLLEDILTAIHNIFEYTHSISKNDFLNDKKTLDAVVRNFEIIGEAAKKIPIEYKLKYSIINWNEVSAFRNKLIHDYFDVDYEIVWKIIESELPQLEKSIIQILTDLEK